MANVTIAKWLLASVSYRSVHGVVAGSSLKGIIPLHTDPTDPLSTDAIVATRATVSSTMRLFKTTRPLIEASV